jgi:hypothetical protein
VPPDVEGGAAQGVLLAQLLDRVADQLDARAREEPGTEGMKAGKV